MSAMTMSFPVKDKASLSKPKEGDKVNATFDKVNSGATVIRIEPR
ncbi:copper-binding protein [Cupriavidus sp. 2MCAB6]